MVIGLATNEQCIGAKVLPPQVKVMSMKPLDMLYEVHTPHVQESGRAQEQWAIFLA